MRGAIPALPLNSLHGVVFKQEISQDFEMYGYNFWSRRKVSLFKILTCPFVYCPSHNLSHGTAFLEKLTFTKLLKEYCALYGTPRFIIMFTGSHYCTRLTQSTSSQPTSPRSGLILSYNLCQDFRNCLFSSVFPNKILYTFLISPMRATRSSHRILLDLISMIIFGEDCKIWSSLCKACSIFLRPLS